MLTDMNRRTALCIMGAALTLDGCTAVETNLTAVAAAAIGKVTATVATDLTSASNLYAIAKGVGEVALATLGSTPAGAAITAAISVGDAVVSALSDAAPAASTVASSASTLLTSANAILLAGAPAIKAVSNSV